MKKLFFSSVLVIISFLGLITTPVLAEKYTFRVIFDVTVSSEDPAGMSSSGLSCDS